MRLENVLAWQQRGALGVRGTRAKLPFLAMLGLPPGGTPVAVQPYFYPQMASESGLSLLVFTESNRRVGSRADMHRFARLRPDSEAVYLCKEYRPPDVIELNEHRNRPQLGSL